MVAPLLLANNKFSGLWFNLLHRWLAPFIIFKHRFYIDKVVAETTDVFSIYLKGKNLQNYKFLP